MNVDVDGLFIALSKWLKCLSPRSETWSTINSANRCDETIKVRDGAREFSTLFPNDIQVDHLQLKDFSIN